MSQNLIIRFYAKLPAVHSSYTFYQYTVGIPWYQPFDLYTTLQRELQEHLN